MADAIISPLRFVLDPGGDDELMLLDWGGKLTKLPNLPWEQSSDAFGIPEANFGTEYARGGVRRTIELAVLRQSASFSQIIVDQVALDAALPANKELDLHIRLASIPWPASSPAIGSPEEDAATDVHFVAAGTVLRRAESTPNPKRLEFEVRFSLSIGALVLQT